MTKQDKSEFFICKGPALDSLKAYKAEVNALVADHEQIQKDFNERAQQQKDVHEAKLHDLWKTLAMRLGLDPVKTWQNPEYQVETRYLDEGFGALVYEPVDPSLAQMMGLAPKTDGSLAVEEVPDKEMLN